MKKFISLLLAATLVLSLAACGAGKIIARKIAGNDLQFFVFSRPCDFCTAAARQ